ncbi:MAG: hypothetical protein IAX21_00035 [Candidatus Bathyarchaeota archaeon]|nr:hypothetical protein [Candidatus Bathyarchaeum tardum]WNZ29298.1 MAG: hypothetical protein IAX21_00035 [Candidatus Bathyarchaeota archaeon]
MDKMDTQKYDLTLIDVKHPGIDGRVLLPRIHSFHPEMVKIVITDFPL